MTGTANYTNAQDANEILQKLDKVFYSAKELFFANAI